MLFFCVKTNKPLAMNRKRIFRKTYISYGRKTTKYASLILCEPRIKENRAVQLSGVV